MWLIDLLILISQLFFRQRRMTVFTKVKKVPDVKKLLRGNESSSTVCVDSTVYQYDERGTLLARIRQYKKFTSLCMIFLLLWLLVASFMAGTFFYRQFHRRPTYYGWCGTSFIQRGRNERVEESVEINPDEVSSLFLLQLNKLITY